MNGRSQHKSFPSETIVASGPLGFPGTLVSIPYLVGGAITILKNMSSPVGKDYHWLSLIISYSQKTSKNQPLIIILCALGNNIISYIMANKKCSKPPTSHTLWCKAFPFISANTTAPLRSILTAAVFSPCNVLKCSEPQEINWDFHTATKFSHVRIPIYLMFHNERSTSVPAATVLVCFGWCGTSNDQLAWKFLQLF